MKKNIILDVLILCVALPTLALILYMAADALLESHNHAQFTMLICIDIAFFTTISCYKKLRNIQLFENFRRPDVVTLIYCVLLTVAIALLWPFLDVVNFVQDLFHQNFEYKIAVRKNSIERVNFSSVYGIFRVLFIMPVMEEIFYRKLIFEKIYTKFSLGTALVLSSLLFSAGHLDPDFFFTAFFLGLILAYSYFKTRNLFVPIFIHALINLSNYILI